MAYVSADMMAEQLVDYWAASKVDSWAVTLVERLAEKKAATTAALWDLPKDLRKADPMVVMLALSMVGVTDASWVDLSAVTLVERLAEKRAATTAASPVGLMV